MTSRRDALKKLFKTLAVAGSGGILWGSAANEAMSAPIALRPPGALESDEFLKACIKCGQCVDACPYDTLKLGSIGEDKAIGVPYFTPRETPCYMCTDYPCTDVCPSGALDLKNLIVDTEKPNIDNAQMGLAVVHKESCIAFWGVQCDACYRACPLMNEAIKLEIDRNETTGKHANFKPVVYSDACTGCGKCEHACVVEKAAIFVLPRDKATGEVGDHYIKSWEKKDEKRMKEKIDSDKDDDKNTESTLDYLNSNEDLFD